MGLEFSLPYHRPCTRTNARLHFTAFITANDNVSQADDLLTFDKPFKDRQFKFLYSQECLADDPELTLHSRLQYPVACEVRKLFMRKGVAYSTRSNANIIYGCRRFRPQRLPLPAARQTA